MDPTETRAHAHLVYRGFVDPQYEPDRNLPPDFAVGNGIAVEVRQLNQLVSAGTRGVDETGIPFRQRIDSVLRTYGTGDQTHWLRLQYRRPLAQSKSLIEGTRAFVDDIQSGQLMLGQSREVTTGVVLQYAHVGEGPGDLFEVGITCDQDLGGFVVAEFRRSLEHCVAEKSRKTAPYRHKYHEWWLILVDHVGYSLSTRSREQYFELPELDHDWNRIVILNPLDVTDYFEIARPT